MTRNHYQVERRRWRGGGGGGRDECSEGANEAGYVCTIVLLNLFPDVNGLCNRTYPMAELHRKSTVSIVMTTSPTHSPGLDREDEDGSGKRLGDGIGVEDGHHVQYLNHHYTHNWRTLPGTRPRNTQSTLLATKSTLCVLCVPYWVDPTEMARR